MNAQAEQLPTRLKLLIAVTALTALAVGSGAWGVVASTLGSAHVLGGVVAVAVVVLIGDVVLLNIRLGRNGNGFTWSEAALIVGVAIGGWACFVAVLGPVILLRQLAVGRPWHKAVFNASGAVVSGGLAWLAAGAVSGDWQGVPTPLTWRAVLGLAAGAAVYFLSVTAQVTTAVAWAQDLGAREVWSRGSHLRLLMFLGNSAVGLVAVLVGEWNRPTVLVLPFFFLLLYVCYNSSLKAQQERDLWRELHAATLSLNRVELPAVLAALQQGARTLFGSERTTLLLVDDPASDGVRAPGLLARGCALSGPATVDVRTEAGQTAAELRRLGLTTATLAPLVIGGRPRGVLLLGFTTPVRFNRRELQMLGTFADQASMSLQHVQLFDEIEDQRTRMSVILGNASDGIMLVDAQGIVRSWNPAMERLTGHRAETVVGTPLVSVLPDGLDGQPLDAARLFAPTGAELSGRIVTAHGEQRDVALTVAVVRDSEADMVVVVARDVTAQREVQQAKEDFIATVSHELRTPLTPIRGYLKMLQRPGFGDDAERRGAAVAVLLEQSDQLERLVEDLLSVFRMRHGHFDVRQELGDVDETVTRAVRDLRLSSARDVVHTRSASPATAHFDAARLQQVVANLLSNADKYSPPEEPVVVTVTATPDAMVEITVTDRGAGVPVESRATVFEPFQRLGHHLTRRTRGTGLGLHIAQRLVEAMGGRVWVDGPPSGGASFHVTVPAVAAVPGSAQAAGEGAPAGKGLLEPSR